MDESLQKLAKEYWTRCAQGETLSLDAWCEQHAELAGRLRDAIEALEPIEDTLLMEQDDDQERTIKAPLFDDRYRILKTLGEGGFGKVYLVQDSFHNNELLALKLVKAEYQNTEAFRKRFQLEIRVLRALHHEGIPPIYNDGVSANGEVYFTMAYVEGRSLHDILESGQKLDPFEVGNYVRQMVNILDYAHTNGVVHRDLKPGNVLITREGTSEARVLILDFGIAKVLKKEGALENAMTMQTEMPIGTPHYMAPEQIRGQEIDGKTDLYALGVMIYRMLVDGYPFKGKTSMEIMAARMHEKPTPLPSDTKPLWAAPLVRELLAQESAGRPSIKEIEALIAQGLEARRRDLRPIGVALAAVVLIVLLILRPWQSGEAQRAPLITEAPQAFDAPGPQPGPQTSAATELKQKSAATPSKREPSAPDSTPGQPPATSGALPMQAKPSVELLPKLPGPRMHTTSAVLVRGQVKNYAGASIQVQGEPLALNADGSFALHLHLDEGPGTLVISDAHGVQLASEPYLVDLTQPELVLETSSAEIITSVARHELSGRASDAHGLEALLCDGMEVDLDDSGAFLHTLELPGEGPRVLRFEALDRAGNRKSVELRFVLDRTPPRISLEAEVPAETQQAAFVLAGSVQDLHVASVELNGRPLALTQGVHFKAPVALELGVNQLQLVARDAAGLRLERNWQIQRTAPLARLPEGCEALPQSSVLEGWASQVRHTKTGIELVYIPAQQELAGFYMGSTEVTRAQYARLASLPSSQDLESAPEHPVADLSHELALAWCDRAGLLLPTTDEWLHAAGESAYPWGDDWSPEYCNWARGTGADHFEDSGPVAAMPRDRNALGLIGLAGNVSEWCDAGAAGTQDKTHASQRSLLGGSFADQSAELCKTNSLRPQGRLPNSRPSIGFRVALRAEGP